MQQKTKIYTAVTTALLTLSIILAGSPMVNCAGSITLTPTAQTPSGSVTVAGTGFAASQAVGIGLGQEVAVTGETHNIPSPSGTGPFTAIVNHYPIKPGSFSFHCTVSSDTNVVESDYTDNGDGTVTSSSTYALNPFMNYVTGEFGRSTTSAWDGYTVTYNASYTYYQYKVTPAAGVTTSSSGTFSASITVPSVANGNYAVTAIDVKGNIGTATLNVNSVIPENLPTGITIVLVTAAIVVSASFLRKRPKRGHH
jgi:hypothetical protein